MNLRWLRNNSGGGHDLLTQCDISLVGAWMYREFVTDYVRYCLKMSRNNDVDFVLET